MTRTMNSLIALTTVFAAIFAMNMNPAHAAEPAGSAQVVRVEKINAMMDEMRERQLVLTVLRAETLVEDRLAKIDNDPFRTAPEPFNPATFAAY